MAGNESVCYHVTIMNIISNLRNVVTELGGMETPLVAHLAIHAVVSILLIKHILNPMWICVLFSVMVFALFKTESVESMLNTEWKSFGFKRNHFEYDCLFMYGFWVAPLSFNLTLVLILLYVDNRKKFGAKKRFVSDSSSM